MERRFSDKEIDDFLSQEFKRLEPAILDHLQSDLDYFNSLKECFICEGISHETTK